MATRSCIARRTEDGGWKGRYVHWDGSPDGRVPVLLDLIERKGIERVRNVIIDWNLGWSIITGNEEPLGAGYDDGRFISVSDYGVAYSELQFLNTDEESKWVASYQAVDPFIEWVYILEDESMTILENIGGKYQTHSKVSYDLTTV